MFLWRAALTELLRNHADVHLSHIKQYEFGAPAIKPTGLLACRMPYLQKILRMLVLNDVPKPREAAIGLGADGTFKTSPS